MRQSECGFRSMDMRAITAWINQWVLLLMHKRNQLRVDVEVNGLLNRKCIHEPTHHNKTLLFFKSVT